MNAMRTLLKSKRFVTGFALLAALLLFMFVFPLINTNDPTDMIGMKFQPPGEKFPLGTDNFGRDVLLSLAHGTKVSLYVGALAGLIATAIGLTLGLVSGYVGGVVDNIITVVTNIFTVIPSFIVLILLTTALQTKSTTLIGVVIGLTAWPWTARSVRAQTTSLRGRDHVNIAKISGHSTARIILMEVMPYIASYVFMAFTLQVAQGVLSEASISMLGLGPQGVITLGLLLQWALAFSAPLAKAWWAFVPPAILVATATFAMFLMNSGMDEIFNPKIRS